MSALKGILVAIFLATLMTIVWAFAIPTLGDNALGFVRSGTLSDRSSEPQWVPNTGIVGNVSIGPIRPVCFVPQNSTNTVPSTGTSTTVVVTSQAGEQTSIPVNWSIWAGCELSGLFKAELSPGIYSLTLSNCLQDTSFPGCSQSPPFGASALPITVQVDRGRLTPVNVEIDTGIR
ncbi:hypothetical protein AUF78_17745 [archaeon 13_1_20CM_2_51_12]|nr:MAG: hypothetical protein AUI97_06735 [Crenarchaeota archaeon 13_1_40CM_3_52_17]OLE68087.1 MAG: hypothetical protein AUF78_17745 [archaeon 13_1_20CM_2_51_12]